VSPSLSKPLKQITQIKTKGCVKSMLRKGHELLLGEFYGWLEVFDISSATITHTGKIRDASDIHDIVAIDETQLLIASNIGILKCTKENY
jgi:hypothetical protein